MCVWGELLMTLPTYCDREVPSGKKRKEKKKKKKKKGGKMLAAIESTLDTVKQTLTRVGCQRNYTAIWNLALIKETGLGINR